MSDWERAPTSVVADAADPDDDQPLRCLVEGCEAEAVKWMLTEIALDRWIPIAVCDKDVALILLAERETA